MKGISSTSTAISICAKRCLRLTRHAHRAMVRTVARRANDDSRIPADGELTQQGLEVDLPLQTRDSPITEPPQQIVLEIAADRTLAVNKQPLDGSALEPYLRELFSTRKDKTMYIAADGALRYRDVVIAIDAAKGAGVQQVGIVTEKMRGLR